MTRKARNRRPPVKTVAAKSEAPSIVQAIPAGKMQNSQTASGAAVTENPPTLITATAPQLSVEGIPPGDITADQAEEGTNSQTASAAAIHPGTPTMTDAKETQVSAAATAANEDQSVQPAPASANEPGNGLTALQVSQLTSSASDAYYRFSDENIEVAYYAAGLAFDQALKTVLPRPLDGMRPSSISVSLRGFEVVASLIRAIGPERASTPVIEQELRLSGLFPAFDFAGLASLELSVFSAVLSRLDDFKRTADKAVADAYLAIPLKTRAPVPIEDTIFEPIDGPLDKF